MAADPGDKRNASEFKVATHACAHVESCVLQHIETRNVELGSLDNNFADSEECIESSLCHTKMREAESWRQLGHGPSEGEATLNHRSSTSNHNTGSIRHTQGKSGGLGVDSDDSREAELLGLDEWEAEFRRALDDESGDEEGWDD